MTFLYRRMFEHPYLYSGGVIAKACTITATLIWSAVVLLPSASFDSNPNYQHLLHIVPDEELWGAFFFVVSILLGWRLCNCSPPRMLGIIGYALLALLWSYLWWGVLIIPNQVPRPAAISSSTIQMVLALYAFISNPRDKCADCPARGEGMCPLTNKPCAKALRFDREHRG